MKNLRKTTKNPRKTKKTKEKPLKNLRKTVKNIRKTTKNLRKTKKNLRKNTKKGSVHAQDTNLHAHAKAERVTRGHQLRCREGEKTCAADPTKKPAPQFFLLKRRKESREGSQGG